MPASPVKGAGLRSPVNFTNGPPPPSERSRGESVSSDSSDSSQVTALSVAKRSPHPAQTPRAVQSPLGQLQTASLSNLRHPSRPAAPRPFHDLPLRQHSNSPAAADSSSSSEPVGRQIGHRPRQHSQGYFEPSLASSSNALAMGPLTASQIAAQAAMHVQNPHHIRKRSMTIPDPAVTSSSAARLKPTSPPPPAPTVNTNSANAQYQNGVLGGPRAAAATAASAAFPRSPLHPPSEHAPSPVSEKEQKPSKEKSKMKLFSKPKSIAIIKDKDSDKKHPALSSPSKIAMHSAITLPRFMNASTTSLVDPNSISSASSFYSSANVSTSTLVPTNPPLPAEKEKDKHKHHFLSRPKKKDKEHNEHFNLPLSSASSTSRPTDPSAPQPLYSFAAPASPGHSSTFAKSMSGLDLRHGGRALREKKKEEKAAATSNLTPIVTNASTLEIPFREREAADRASPTVAPGTSSFAPSHVAGPGLPSTAAAAAADYSSVASLGATFGLPGLTPDDAWPLLKARLLHIFEGQPPRTPIEDFNALVTVYIKRCIQRQAPLVLVEDLRELLATGFASLEQTLRGVPEERLVVGLVEMWRGVLGGILPFLMAVFLPLDLEFRGRGVLGRKEAAEFWGVAMAGDVTSPVDGGREKERNKNVPVLGGDELDVRRITLLAFRDAVILPRNDALAAIFSRLSLENISGAAMGGADALPPLQPPPPLMPEGVARPGSARSVDAQGTSFNSQASTLLDSASLGAASSGSLGARSRATSNTSAGSFASIHSPPPPMPTVAMSTVGMVGGPVGVARSAALDSARVTETVGRMLQCVAVLASVQSQDEAQRKMERLSKELKYNWLGRGRTGRQRRGFVGMRGGRGVVGVA